MTTDRFKGNRTERLVCVICKKEKPKGMFPKVFVKCPVWTTLGAYQGYFRYLRVCCECLIEIDEGRIKCARRISKIRDKEERA